MRAVSSPLSFGRYVVSNYILSEAGGRALHRTHLPSPAKGLLLERAAARVSFQPRFVRVHVVGMAEASELPGMDRSGLSDAYVCCHLRSPDGLVYPERGVSTRTRYVPCMHTSTGTSTSMRAYGCSAVPAL